MKKYALVAGLIALALLLASLSVRVGITDISSIKILDIILSELGLLTPEGAGVSAHERAIIWHIRLPRTLTGAFVGASLALSGVMLQGLFRNPMASPVVIGISTGGALGATSAIALGLGAASIWAVPLSAFGGALLTVVLVSLVASHKGHTPLGALILCGMAMNSIAGALTTLVLSYSVSDFEIARQILFWLMGSLTNRTWEHVFLVAPFFAASAVAAAFFGRELNLMMSGRGIRHGARREHGADENVDSRHRRRSRRSVRRRIGRGRLRGPARPPHRADARRAGPPQASAAQHGSGRGIRDGDGFARAHDLARRRDTIGRSVCEHRWAVFPLSDHQESRARGDVLMMLNMQNVSVELGERDVLKNVSADFHPGALTGVIGPNGAGQDDAPARTGGSAARKGGAHFAGGRTHRIVRQKRNRPPRGLSRPKARADVSLPGR